MIHYVDVTNHRDETYHLPLSEEAYKEGMIITTMDGIGPTSATINMSPIADSDANAFNSAYLDKRNITMTIMFLDQEMSVEQARQKSYLMFPPKQRIHLSFKTDIRTVGIDGYVESNEPKIFSEQVESDISILCDDPYFYNEDIERHLKMVADTASGTKPMFHFRSNMAKILSYDKTQELTRVVVEEANITHYTNTNHEHMKKFYDRFFDNSRPGEYLEDTFMVNLSSRGANDWVESKVLWGYLEMGAGSVNPSKYYLMVAPVETDGVFAPFVLGIFLEPFDRVDVYMATLMARLTRYGDVTLCLPSEMDIPNKDAVEEDVYRNMFSNLKYKEKIVFGRASTYFEHQVYYEGEYTTGVFFELTFEKECQNPFIRNLTTKKKISILTDNLPSVIKNSQPEFKAGDKLYIQTKIGEKSLTLLRDGQYYNVFPIFDPDGDWIQFVSGINYMAYSAEKGALFMKVNYYYKTAYIGV